MLAIVSGFSRIFFVGLLFLIASLSGCDIKPQKPLRVGTNVWIGYETLYLARNLGYLENTPIKLIELPSATDVSRAFRNHMLEVAALTLDETLALLQTESDIRAILVMDISNGADTLIAQPDIDSLAKLKGKSVGVENTAVGAILLDGALSAARLQPVDIKIIPITADKHLQAFIDKKIDAVVTFEPVKQQLLSLGGKELFNSTQIPGRIIDILITRETIIQQRSDDLKQLLSAYFEALQYLHNNPQKSADIIAPRLNLDKQQVLPLYNQISIPDVKQNLTWLKRDHARLLSLSKQLTQLMLEKKLLFKEVDFSMLPDESLLPHNP